MSMQNTGLVNSFLDNEKSYNRIASRYADDGLVVQQLDGRILWANPAYCTLMGRSLDEILGRNPLTFCMPEGEQPSDDFIANFRYIPKEGVRDKLFLARNRHTSGHVFWMQISTSYHRYADNTWVVILVCRDVSLQMQKEQQLRKTSAELERLANSDPLTGLYNRAAVGHFMTQTLAKDAVNKTGLFQIDMDRFKAINDSYGHSAGDAVLKHVADKLREIARTGDMAARMGGDEFVLVCPNMTSVSQLQKIGADLCRAIHSPIQSCGYQLICKPSIGAALEQNGSVTVEEFLHRSDFALYEAKRVGRGTIAIYDQQLHARQQEEALLAKELKQTLHDEGLTYYFQPTYSMSSLEVRGFETLVRWNHKRLGIVSPDKFLPLAKRLGLMAAIDFGAINAALNLKATLNANGFHHIRVGFNGSEELLSHPEFFERLTQSIDDRGIAPKDIIIEVLETVVFDDMSQQNPLVATVQQLHDAGFVTLLDDFGTGHAGLAHMAKLAVSGLKIDRSLTKNILSEATSAKIIGMIIDLCADLGFYVVTEGIETVEEANELNAMGGNVIQGYWVSHPLPEDQVLDWLAAVPDMGPLMKSSAIAPRPTPSYLERKL